ncbi:MAG TPA: DEAD/DEAH box helicase [Candidatus Limiplasma sp.]|nr:DEAD/DEAH box helicase [Candidatus Limiplasma sp.]HRX07654.1 DEAD/DEAH box helicase [Candidatus Limiplasma sp.]
MSSFESLQIIQPILKALQKQEYEIPTPIQEQAIPPLLQRKDLLGCAQTGTGKTAAFAIPILQHLHQEMDRSKPKRIRALVLSPTRELAAQIGASFSTYGAYLGIRNTVIFGGVSQKPQEMRLRNGVDILVATPGRLLDLMGQRLVNLQHVSYFVLDEADRMLDMGFLHDVEKIIAQLPTQRQTMLFSATMPPGIEKLTKTILINPVKVAVTPVSSTVDTIDQSVYFVNKQNKVSLLIDLLKTKDVASALVFSRTKHGADKIARRLNATGIEADVIHSNKSQNARQLALSRFKSGHTKALIATDIVARGIDIDELSHVINFDLPEVPEAYVHRIGRTARAGLTGTAISFCDETEKKLLFGIEKLIGKQVAVVSKHPYPLVVSHEPQTQPLARPVGRPTRNRPDFRYSRRK